MSPLRQLPHSFSPRLILLMAVIIGVNLGPSTTRATDFNADYEASSTCGEDHGGVALTLMGDVSVTGYYINSTFSGYAHDAASCGFTIVSWASDGGTSPCIGFGDFVHVGVSTADVSATVLAAVVYNVDPDASLCSLTPTLTAPDACSSDSYHDCSLIPSAPQGPLAQSYRYSPLSLVRWRVHTDGKSITVINGPGWPADDCNQSVYLGDVAFEYYEIRQPLSTLNADSLRQPLATVGVDLSRDSLACGDTLTISRDGDPPAAAKFFIATATVDVVPSLDSPRASRVWIQETIVRPGEHLLVAKAGEHGMIDPAGAIAVPDGGEQTFVITPDAGYRVADVLVDDVSVGPVPTYTFSAITADHTIAAEFEPENSVPDCEEVVAVPDVLWPPNHKFVTVRLAGLTDPDGDPVEARITHVTQDEPVGSGSHGVDAIVDSTDTCQLRAERDGNGNGRVYTLWFTATDGRGGECPGSVQVCVPHDRHALECVDDGQNIDSVSPESGGGTGSPGKDRAQAPRLEIRETVVVGHQATTEYNVPSAGKVRLALFDVAGRRIMTIENSVLAEGTHRSTWSTAELAGGVYFYRLNAGPEVVVGSVVIR